MPPRRRSVVSDAGSRDDQLDSAGSDGEYTAKRSATGGGRGARGRGRGRSSVRARARGRGAAAAARAAARRIDDDEEDEEDENSESDFENQASRSPRPVSPELGVSTAPALALTPPPTAAAVRSSSLSLLSSPSSSPAAPEQQDPPPPHDVEPSSIQREAAILSSLNGNHASLLPTPADVGFGSPTSSSAGTVKHAVALEDDLTADSLSELESELTDNENNLPFSSQDVSTNSTPAPSAENGYSPAPKRRGRPPGSRNKQHKPPAPRSARTAVAARPSLVSAASGSGTTSGGTRSRGGETGGRSRATRANVTLPAGYIEGVTSSRWPRKRGERDDDDSLPGTTTPGESRASSVATSLGGGFEEDDEEKKALLTPKAADLKGKSRAVEEDEEDELMSVVEAEVIEEEKAAAVSMSRETSLDGPPTPSKARNGPGRPRGKGKRGGKKGVVERVAPEPIERAKRRKLSVDEEALQRAAAREVARFNFLAQLEDEAKAVVDRTHPLLAFTYQRLTEEKAEKLEQLRLYQEERESEYARLAEARLRHIWGAWADRKDSLRTDLYFETSANLKDLIFEERSLPFFRDHPLFTNTHDLPPPPFYRGPVRDPAFVPRSIIHAGHYVEPPPQNSAVEHNSWKLSSSEIEADLALFYDIDDEPYAPPMLPATPAPPVNAYPYSNPYYPPPPALGSYLPPPPPHLASVPPHMSSYPPPPIHSGFYPPPPQPVAAPPAPAQHPQHPPHPPHPQHPHHHPHQHHQPPPSQPAPRPQTQAAPPPAKPQAPVAPPPRPVIDQRIPAPATMPPPPSMKPVVKPPAAAPAKAAPTPAPSTAAKQSSQNGHYPPPPVPLPPRQGGLPLPHSHAHPLSQFHHHHHPAPPVTSTPSPAAPKPSIPSIASAGYGSSPFGARSPYTSSTSSLAHPASGGTHSTGHGHSQPRTQLHHHQPTRSPNPAATSPPAPQHLGGAGSPAFSPAQSLRPSPSLSAPKLPSLTHRATPSAQTSMPSASPPVQPSSTSSAPHFPSLFGGDRSNSGLRPPLGLGGLLGGGSGLGGMSAPLGFGPATGLPLPSWLKPLPKPNVGVAPPSGVAGAGDAAGVKKEALSPLPQVQTAPGARPYWT